MVALSAALTLGAVCAGEETGPGQPQLQVSFPEQVQASEVATATLTVINPGPEEIGSLVVSFSLVGSAGGTVSEPLVASGARKQSPSIEEVRPEPGGVSLDGVVFRFSGDGSTAVLDAGEEISIEFDIRVPRPPGLSASSVQVYAGENPERAQGVRLETEVLP
ncbi:MAG: hypothetical protein M3454_10740 [Actinomycetota bacterium]|nr:hypothetical protein [Actinomycetota bacterium]